jgi:hypothetical protein
MAAPQYVIVVAGIGGNELYLPSSLLFADIRVWLDTLFMATPGWRLLGLKPDGHSQAVPGFSDLVGRNVLADYYGGMSNNLARAGMIPVSYQQDWRIPLAAVKAGLRAQIAELGAERRVHIVCHSSGGLLAAQVLADMTPAERLATVGRVVGLGVPHLGSWEACGLLGGWNETYQLLRLLLVGTTALLGPIGLPGSLAQVTGSWPAAYEIFPAPASAGTDQSQIDWIYSPAAWAARPTVLPLWLAAARSRWATAGAVPGDVDWLDVCGTGQQTPDGIIVGFYPGDQVSYLWTDQGDGAVTLASAHPSGARPYYLTAADHSAMVTAPGVTRAMLSWLRDGKLP